MEEQTEETTEELPQEPRTYTFTVSRPMAIVGAVVLALVIAGASFAIGRSTAGDDHGGPPGAPSGAFGEQGFGGGSQGMPGGSQRRLRPARLRRHAPGSAAMPEGGMPPGALPSPGGGGSGGGSGSGSSSGSGGAGQLQLSPNPAASGSGDPPGLEAVGLADQLRMEQVAEQLDAIGEARAGPRVGRGRVDGVDLPRAEGLQAIDVAVAASTSASVT